MIDFTEEMSTQELKNTTFVNSFLSTFYIFLNMMSVTMELVIFAPLDLEIMHGSPETSKMSLIVRHTDGTGKYGGRFLLLFVKVI